HRRERSRPRGSSHRRRATVASEPDSSLGGIDASVNRVVAPLLAVSLLVGLAAASGSRGRGNVIRVPQDAPTIPPAIDSASPGDVVLVDRGTYPGGVVVPESKPQLTIRGVDRNAVVIDGGDTAGNGIVVRAD